MAEQPAAPIAAPVGEKVNLCTHQLGGRESDRRANVIAFISALAACASALTAVGALYFAKLQTDVAGHQLKLAKDTAAEAAKTTGEFLTTAKAELDIKRAEIAAAEERLRPKMHMVVEPVPRELIPAEFAHYGDGAWVSVRIINGPNRAHVRDVSVASTVVPHELGEFLARESAKASEMRWPDRIDVGGPYYAVRRDGTADYDVYVAGTDECRRVIEYSEIASNSEHMWSVWANAPVPCRLEPEESVVLYLWTPVLASIGADEAVIRSIHAMNVTLGDGTVLELPGGSLIRELLIAACGKSARELINEELVEGYVARIEHWLLHDVEELQAAEGR